MTTAETRAGALPDLADVPARDLRSPCWASG